MVPCLWVSYCRYVRCVASSLTGSSANVNKAAAHASKEGGRGQIFVHDMQQRQNAIRDLWLWRSKRRKWLFFALVAHVCSRYMSKGN